MNDAYTAFKNKVGDIDSLPGTLKEYIDNQDASARTEVAVSGSGISVAKTAGIDGHDIYTITADQSIWEFMGEAESASTAVAATLNSYYGTGEGKKRLNPEKGDVWAVTLTDQENSEVLYACSDVDESTHTGTWVVIGSAQGVTGINTGAHNGINLTNTANVVGLNVVPGSVADGDTSVVTGGAVWSAIDTAYTKLYSYTTNEIAAEAAAREQAYTDAEAYTDEKVATEHDLAYAYANSRATEAQANAYAKIETLDANITGDEKYGTYAYVSYSLTQEDGKVTGANVSVNLSVIENYVVDNLWEEYSAPQP